MVLKKKRSARRGLQLSLAVAGALGSLVTPAAQAATLIFDSDANGANGINEAGGTFTWQSGTTSTFINPSNPTTEVFTTNNFTTDIAQFGNGGVLNSGATINVGTGSITGLIFGPTLGNGYTLTNTAPAVLTLGAGNIVVNAGAQNTTVGDATNLSLSIGAAQTWTNASASALNINGNIADTGNFLLTLGATGAGAINLTSGITGADTSGITVNSTGTGIVTLSGANAETGATTLTAGTLRATTNAGALGAGTLTLTSGTLILANDTGLAFNRNTTVSGNSTIITDRLTAGAGVTETLGTLSIGNFTLTNNVGNLVNATGTTGVTFGAVTMTAAATFNTNNNFVTGTGTPITNTLTMASLGGNFNAAFGGTGTATITGVISGTGALTLTKNGSGTLNVNGVGNSPGTGVITINGGTVSIGSGGTLTSRALTFGSASNGGGTFNFNAASTAAVQSMGTLSFLGGDGTVQSTYGAASGNAGLTFSSLAARTVGATGNFIVSGGANGTTNAINLTGAAAGFLNAGLFFGGADYAWMDGAGTFVRAPIYGTDAATNTVAAAATTLTATSHNLINTSSGTSGTVTLSAPAIINSLKMQGATTLAAGANLVTTPAILLTGGASATISGATGITTGGASDLVFRTDTSADILNVSALLTSGTTGGITKTGAGKLVLTNTANAFTGNVNINGGTLEVSLPASSATSILGGQIGGTFRPVILNGGTLRMTQGTFNDNAASATNVGFIFTIGAAGGTFDLTGAAVSSTAAALVLDDPGEFAGTGDLTKIGTGTLYSGSATADWTATFLGRIFVNQGTVAVAGAGGLGSSGSTSVGTFVASGGAVDVVGAVTTPETITIAGTGVGGTGALLNSAAVSSGVSGPVILAANSTVGASNAAGIFTLSGSISDGGNNFTLTKVGAGTVVLTGANIFTGGTTLSAGTLLIGNNSALGTGTLTVSAGSIAANGTSSFVTTNAVTLNADTTFGQAATNLGALTFGALNLGGGTRTLTVNNPSTNAITFGGAVTNGTGLTLAGTGTLALAGTGSFTGPVVVNQGGTLSVGATTLNAINSLSVGTTATSSFNLNADGIGAGAILASGTNVTFGGATSFASLGFQLGNTSNYDSLTLTVGGSLTVGAGGAVISISALTGFGAGTYTLITAPTITGFSNITLNNGTLPTGFTYSFSTSSTNVILGVTATTAGNMYFTGANGASWNAGAPAYTATNWSFNAAGSPDAASTPGAANTVNFSATSASVSPFTTTLDQNFSVLGVNFLNSGTGAATVNQGTFGSLTIGTGGINVNTGAPSTATINAPIALGGAQTWTVTDAASTLSIQGGAPANGIVSGNFGITLAGAGKVSLGGFNTFTGGVTTSATGTLNINNGGSTTTNSALGTGAITFAAGTTLDNTSGVAQSVLTTGAQTWNGNITFAGTNSLSLPGTITLGANRQVTVNGGTLALTGVVQAGAFGISKLGTGALTLSGTNLNTGQFVLSAGTVNFNSAGAIGAAGATLALNGGTIDNTSGASVTLTATGATTLGANVNFVGSAPLVLPGAITLTADRSFTTAGPGLGVSNSVNFSGVIGGNFNITKLGKGTLVLGNGANTFGSAGKLITLSEGTLIIGPNGGLGNVGNVLVISASAGAAVAIDASGGSTPTQGVTVSSDFAYLGAQALRFSADTTALGGANRTITLMSAANRLTLNVISGTVGGALTVNGIGLLDSDGASTYTGATTINPGSTFTLGSANGTAQSTGSLASTSLVLNGGTFKYARTAAVSQAFSSGVTIGSGAASITTSTNTQTLTLNGLSRSSGGTLDVNAFAGSTVTTTTINAGATGILGGWATVVGGANWAVGSTAGAATNITAYAAYTPSIAGTTAPGAGTNVDFQASNTTPWTNQSVNSLRFGPALPNTLTLTAGNTLTLDSGGILVTPTVAANASVITGGTISTTGDLIINDFATTGTLNINSAISAAGLTKSGTATGAAIIGGTSGNITNSLTGTVTVNAGVLQVNSTSASGGNGATGALNSLPIVLNGGTLALNFDGDGTNTANSINLADNVTVNGNAAITAQRLGSGNPIGAATFTTPLNKTLQFGTLTFGNAGRTLTVTPSNGYGVEFTGTTTLNQNLTTINVGTVTASNVVQGLTLSGNVTGTIAGGSWTKAGAGTLVLNNGANDFSGNIILSAGTLAFNNDSAVTGTNTPLGNTANTITFTGATAATTLRAFGGTVGSPLTINTSRTINLWGTTTANNVIEVAANTTLQLNTAFGGSNSPLTKSDIGTLVLNADNGLWAGQLSISAGAVQVTNSGALGISTATATGNTVVAATGAALQLSNVSIWDQLAVTGSGINAAGALQALSGTTDTTNGLITLSGAASIGADSTATLNIRGGISGAQTLTFVGGGTINVDTTPLPALTSITKNNSGGVTTISTANPLLVGAITVNAGTLVFGGAAGSVGNTGAITVNPGGSLTVNDSVGLPVANRLGGRAVTLDGGTFNYIGNSKGASSESLGVLTMTRAGSTITVTADPTQQANLSFNSLAGRSVQDTALFSGPGLGSAPGAGVGTITFGVLPTFVGAGATGTNTKGILQYIVVKDTTSGAVGFGTTDSSGGSFMVRRLSASEQTASQITGVNYAPTGSITAYTGLTFNSLNLSSSAALTVAPVQTLTVTSGGILANGSNTINGGIVSAGTADLIVHALGNVTLNSTITGSGGLTKAGSGILTLGSAEYYTGNTNINQGTVQLGINNAIMPGSAIPINGTGTLDLNGHVQTTGVFLGESTAQGTGGSVLGTAAASTLVLNQDAAARVFEGVMSGAMSFARSGGNNTVVSLTLTGNSTYTGATLINGNQLLLTDAGRLSGTGTTGTGTPGTSTGIEINYAGLAISDNGTTAVADRVNDAATITMRGGFIAYTGRDATASTETFGTLNLAQGNNRINNTVGGGTVRSSDLTFGTVTQSNGATLLLEGSGLTGTATALGLIGSTNRVFFANGAALASANNGIIPWASVNATELVGYNPTYGAAALSTPGFQGYDVNLATAATLSAGSLTQNMRLTSAVVSANYLIPTVGGTYNANGIAWATGAATQGLNFTTGTDTLNLTSGALVVAGNFASNIGSAAGNGILTSGGTASSGTSDLYLSKNGGNTLTVNSSIQDSGIGTAKTRLVVTLYNASGVTLSGNDTYTGGTIVNGSNIFSGTLTLTNASANGTSVYTIPGDLTVNGASVTLSTGGQIKNTGVLTINGGGRDGTTAFSTVTLAGNNTLAGVNFNNLGGGSASVPTLALGAGIFTLNGNINATSSNVASTATISGGASMDLNAATRTVTVDPILFNGQSVSPDQPTLTISSIITATGAFGLNKAGNGLLQLSGASTFTGGIDLQAGGLIIAASSTGGPPPTSGPLGTGTLTIEGGTTITADNTARSVGNAVTLNGDFTFGVRGSIAPAQNGATVPLALTLSGPIGFGTSVFRTITSNSGPTIANTIAGQITGSGTLIKDGIGFLVLSNVNNATTFATSGSQAVQVKNGTLEVQGLTGTAFEALGTTPGSTQADNIVLNGGVLSLNLTSATGTLDARRGILVGAPAGSGIGTISVASAKTYTVAGTIADNGTGADSFYKAGAGTLNLTGAMSFTGDLSVGAGTLNYTNAAAPTPGGLAVAAGATLNLLNNAGQGMNLGSGTINLGAGTTGTTTLGLELAGTGAYDSFTTTAAAATLGTVQMNITGLTGFGAGTYNLLTAASGLNSATYKFVFSGAAAGFALTPSITPTNVSLIATAAPNFYWTNAQADGKWNTLANNTLASNWATNAAGTIDAHNMPGPTSTVNFSASAFTNATATIATTLETPITIDNLVFNNNVTSTAPATITAITIGAGAAGTLTIAPATNTNGITLNTGAPAAVTIAAPLVLGAQQTWSVADAATVLTLSGGITGNGFNVNKDGSGVVQMQGTNTYTGSTTITNGVLRAGATNGLDANSAFIVGATGTLRMNTFSAAVASLAGSPGAIVDNNTAAAATLTTGNDNTSTNFQGNIINGSTATMGLTKVGTGALTLSGTNIYTGNTTVNTSVGNTGTLNITGSITGNQTASTLAYGGTAGNSIVNVSGSLTQFITTGANIAGAVTVFNQTAGTVTIVPTNGQDVQWVAKTGYGMLNITGGTFNTGRFDGIASGGTNATAVIYVGGAGTPTLNQNVGDYFLLMRTNGQTEMTVGPGGSFTRQAAVSNAFNITMDGTNSYGVFNVAGGTVDAGPAKGLTFGFGAPGTGNVGMVNVAGGSLNLGANTALGATAGATAVYFNFTGGTLKANAALTGVIPANNAGITLTSTLFGPVTNNNNANTAFNTQVGASSNFTGGLMVDTNGNAVTLSNPLLGAATSYAVTQAAIGDVSLKAGNSGYIGAPMVTFSAPSGGGVPASGYALISGGVVTGIVITDPGTYALNEQPTITLSGGGGTIAPFTTAALATLNGAGGITKIGAGTLTVTNATSTYTGGVTINQGTFALGINSAIPSANNVTVSGGVLDMLTFNNTVATVSLQSGTIQGSTGVLTATNTYDLQSGTVNFSSTGSLAGSVGATKSGAGTVTLLSANTFSGAVNVNGGVLSFSNPNQLGNASVTNTIGFNGGILSYSGTTSQALGANRVVTINAGGGTFDVPNLVGTLTVTAGISNTSTGNLTKTGAGSVIIPGNGVNAVNLGSGSVNVSAGTLQAGFNTSGASAVSVGATGNLNMTNGAAEVLTLSSNATGALTLASGATLGFELNGTSNDEIIVGGATGTASVGTTSPITLNFTPIGSGVVANTYTLLSSANGGLDPSGATYSLGTGLPGGFNYSLSVTDNLVQLMAVTFAPIYWTNSQGNGSWATLNGGTLSNFSTDSAGATNNAAIPIASNTVIFNASSVTGTTVTSTLDGLYTIYSLQFENIGGTSTVTAVNVNPGSGGTITIAPGAAIGGIDVGNNAGTITINAGVGVVASNSNNAAQTWNVDGTGTSSLTVNGNVTFAASVTKTGNGALTLAGTNTGSGNFTLSGGTVNANSNGALGTGIFTVAAGTTIGNTSAGAVTLANSSHVWNGNFTSAGTQALNLGTAPVIMGASLTATVNNTLIVGGVIDDGINTYSLTKAGTGALTLSGANTYGGGTTLSAGTLNINSTTAIGSGAFTLGGGTFDTTNVNTTLTTNNPVLWTNGASVAFTGTKTLNLGTGAVTFGNDATVSSFTITNNSVLAGTSLTFGGNITSGIGGTAGIKTLTVAGTGDTALNGSITTGTAAGLVLVKNGASNLTIGGAASLFENNVGTSLLTLNGGTVTIASGATLTLNNSGTSGIGGTGGTINGPGTIVLASGTAGNYQDWNGTTTINAKITGAFGIDFYNSGTMTLTNTSSDFTGSPDLGPTTVSVAVIGNSGSTSPLGTNGTINFTFSTSTTGKLIYTGTGETSNKVIALAGTTAGGVGTIDQSGTGPLKFTANLTAGAATHTLVLQGSPANPAVATGEIAGIIKDNSGTFNTAVNKLGTSTWILSALNSYTGITTIAGGILTTGPGGILANGGVASSIGQSTNVAANLVLNGGTLQYANTGAAESTDRLFTLGTGGGTLDASGTSPITFAGNGANALAYAGTTTRTLTLTGSNTGANTLAPILADATGATSLSKTGAGTWLVTGLSTFTGPTTISGGVLSTGTSGILANGGTASSIGKSTNVAANLVLNGGTLQYANTGAAESTDRLFTLGTGGGTLDASGTNAITFAGNGANAIAYAGTTTRTLTLTGSNTGNNTLAPILADATGATSLSKTGAGTWLVTGLNTFTGATGISAGTLAVNAVATGASAQPLGKNTGANAVTLGVASTSSGVLKYTGGVGSLDKNITAVGNGGDAIVNAGSGALTLSGTLTKNGTVLTLNGGTNGIHVTGTIVGIGPGSDLVADTGLTFLDNANTYNGPTFIRNGGTLNATVAGALPTSPRSAVTMDDIGSGTSTLGLTASQSIASLTGATTSVGTISNTNTLTVGTTSGRTTFAGGISGAGGFTKDGASTQVLGGVNGYTGATAVNAGNLVVNGSLASGSTVTVADLATIDGKGTVQGSLTLTSGAQNLGAPTTSGGTIAAGDGAVGKLTVASATFGSAAPVTGQQTTYNWKFTNADATNGLGTNAGTFYDTLSITTLSVTGAVDVIASAISPVQLDPTLTYQFKIISGTGSGDTNSAATQFHLDNSSYAAFQSANLATTAADYSFSGDTSGDVFINYNAAPEPTSMMLLGLGVGGLALRRRRRTVKSSTLSM